jgi:hypothetical protein
MNFIRTFVIFFLLLLCLEKNICLPVSGTVSFLVKIVLS